MFSEILIDIQNTHIYTHTHTLMHTHIHRSVNINCIVYDRNILETTYITIEKEKVRSSQVAQWLRIHLPVCRTWVQSLVRELRSHVLQSK